MLHHSRTYQVRAANIIIGIVKLLSKDEARRIAVNIAKPDASGQLILIFDDC
jgi:hypothetical protein